MRWEGGPDCGAAERIPSLTSEATLPPPKSPWWWCRWNDFFIYLTLLQSGATCAPFFTPSGFSMMLISLACEIITLYIIALALPSIKCPIICYYMVMAQPALLSLFLCCICLFFPSALLKLHPHVRNYLCRSRSAVGSSNESFVGGRKPTLYF